jgi:ADP-ribose pyrophosphatase YjhB (NUDIX family)
MDSLQNNVSLRRTMITFQNGQTKFTYRIGGIAVHNGHILFQKSTQNPENIFWFLPGGRAELGECAKETLEREMMEEIGTAVKIIRPLFLVEKFFRQDHEIGLYFLMTFPEDSILYQKTGPFEFGLEQETNLPLIFSWLDITQFDILPIVPAFFRTALQQPLPQHLTHVVYSSSSGSSSNFNP